MSDTSLEVQTAALIQRQFGLDDRPFAATGEQIDLPDLFQNYLAEQILDLMNTRFEFLMHALYRIDIEEQSVRELFKLSDERIIASKLAALVIERQRRKIETRARYGGMQDGDL